MTEVICDIPEIYKVSVPLPGTALKNLNCYIVKSGGESFIVDTGFNLEECRSILMEALDRLKISPASTKLLITHLHSDHMGLAECFDYPDSVIYMSRTEYDYYRLHIHGEYWELSDRIFLEGGMPPEELAQSKIENPAIIYAPKKDFAVHTLNDGDLIRVGDLTIRAIEVGGHTPGQMCFYIEEYKVMFLADHVLFDITPNITNWPLVEDCLHMYLSNLDKIEAFEIKTALPGHRNLSDKTVYTRIREIREHHRRRLAQICSVLADHPGLNAYELAGQLTWSLRGRRWEDAPKQQKWFAMGEAMAHLEYLVRQGKIKEEGHRFYICGHNG